MEDKDRTLYCGNLSDKVTDDLLYELFLQAGPLENVVIPKEKDGRRRNYGFITFKHAISVPYAVALMNGISLYGRALRLNARNDAQPEHNPYLEKFIQYRNSTSQASPSYNNRSYGHDKRGSYDDRRDSYDDRSRHYDSRRYESRTEHDRKDFDTRNSPHGMAPSPVSYPVFNSSYYSSHSPQHIPQSINPFFQPQNTQNPPRRYDRSNSRSQNRY